jgi:hypothetical protein
MGYLALARASITKSASLRPLRPGVLSRITMAAMTHRSKVGLSSALRLSTLLTAIIAYTACVAPVAKPPVAKNGMTVGQAQDASVRLEPGMTRDQVLQVLGHPTDAESQTVVQNTDQPWQALVWNYRWQLDDYRDKRLVLFYVFAEGSEWRLNNWMWF